MGLPWFPELCGSLLGLGGLLDSWRARGKSGRSHRGFGLCRERSGCRGPADPADSADLALSRADVEPQEVPPARGVDGADLEACLRTLPGRVRQWDQDGSYSFVKTLQECVRNHGVVTMMEDRRDMRKVAVKCMPNSWLRKSPAEFASRYGASNEQPWLDLAILTELNKRRYPYACELFGIFRDDEHTHVVTSLATQGDLFEWCSSLKLRPGPQREALLLPIASQMFSAVRWLHNLGLAHRDLSLENVLLTDSPFGAPQVRLVDFAQATASRACRLEPRGKPVYQAPEMHGEAAYDAFLADAFALGAILFTMAVQGYPWESTSKLRACPHFQFAEKHGVWKLMRTKKVKLCGGRFIPEVLSPDLIELILGLLEFQPDVRFHLGENCMQDKSKAWRSVWMTNWLQEAPDAGDRCGGAPGEVEAEATASTRCGSEADASSGTVSLQCTERSDGSEPLCAEAA